MAKAYALFSYIYDNDAVLHKVTTSKETAQMWRDTLGIDVESLVKKTKDEKTCKEDRDSAVEKIRDWAFDAKEAFGLQFEYGCDSYRYLRVYVLERDLE